MPIVRLNRTILVVGIVLGGVFRQPLATTALFAVLLPTTIWGQRASLIAWAGRRLLRSRIIGAEFEDARLMRFNNTIATLLLGGAQICFLLHAPVAGWALSAMVALAAAVALAGYCVGCFLYFQLRQRMHRRDAGGVR
jgi:hypothetical protein